MCLKVEQKKTAGMIFSFRLLTLNFQLSTLNLQPSTFNWFLTAQSSWPGSRPNSQPLADKVSESGNIIRQLSANVRQSGNKGGARGSPCEIRRRQWEALARGIISQGEAHDAGR
jgi:hypothetical protein